MIKEIIELFQIDWKSFISSLCILIVAFMTIYKMYNSICEHLGLETKFSKDKKEQKELLMHTSTALHNLESRHNEEYTQLLNLLNEFARHSDERDTDLTNKIESVLAHNVERDKRRDYISAMQIRHSLVRACEEAIFNGKLSSSTLRSIEDLYEVYSRPEYLNMNSYVTDLIKQVRALDVVPDKR